MYVSGLPLPTMWEIWVQSLGQEDPLEEEMATQPSILAWRIPMDRGAWQATVYGVSKSWTKYTAHTVLTICSVALDMS